MQGIEIEPLVSAARVAEALDVSSDTVYRYVRTEGLPARRMAGGRLKFRLSDVEEWVTRRRVVIVTPDRPAATGRPAPGPTRLVGAEPATADRPRKAEMKRFARRGAGA